MLRNIKADVANERNDQPEDLGKAKPTHEGHRGSLQSTKRDGGKKKNHFSKKKNYQIEFGKNTVLHSKCFS